MEDVEGRRVERVEDVVEDLGREGREGGGVSGQRTVTERTRTKRLNRRVEDGRLEGRRQEMDVLCGVGGWGEGGGDWWVSKKSWVESMRGL